MKKGLFAKKNIQTLLAQNAEKKDGLKRSLTAFDLVLMGIGAIIGAGLFVLTGKAAAQNAGPAVSLSFALASIICIFSAFCYAELASMIPISGSAYTYAYVALGEFSAWIIGWSLTLEYLLSCSTVAGGWAGYVVSFLQDFGVTVPANISNAPITYDPLTGWACTGAFLNVPAVVIMLLIGFLVSIGVRTAAFMNNLLVFLKMGVILLFVVCGLFYINTGNWIPFIPENTGVFGQYGLSGILRGAGVVFFAFIGFDAISTLAQEARNPQKDLPVGMIGSLTISTIVYMIVALILTGVVSYTLLGVPDPIAVAFSALGPKFTWMRPIVNLAIIAGLTSVILVMLMGQARIFYTMAKDGLLPKAFGKTHKKFQTPFFSTWVITFLAALMAGLFPVEILGQLVSMGALLGFAIVCFGVLVLRRTQPNIKRPFKTPLYPWIPILGTLVCLGQMALLPGMIWTQLILWIIVGCGIYYLYGRKHSLVRHGK